MFRKAGINIIAALKLIAAIFFVNNNLNGQVNRDVWSYILKQDQDPKNRMDSAVGDKLLIQTYKLILTGGYPHFPEDLRLSETPILVWVHCKNNSLKWNTFSMHYSGFEKGIVDGNKMMNYILRSLYLDLYCRQPERRANTNNDQIEQYIDALGLKRQMEDVANIFNNPTPFDTLAYLSSFNGKGRVVGSWIRDFEPYYFKCEVTPIITQIVEIESEFYYVELAKNFIPQRLNYIEDVDIYRFKNGDGSYIRIDANMNARLFSAHDLMLYEYKFAE